MPACQSENALEIIAGGRPTGRVRGRVDDDSPRPGRHRGFESAEIEIPAVRPGGHRQGDRASAVHLDGGLEIRPGRSRHDHLVSRPGYDPHRHLEGMHPTDRDVEALGIERSSEQAARVPGDRLPQLGDAALPGVEGLAGGERTRRRIRDEGRGRPVPLADPERDQPLPPAPVIGDLHDPALGHAGGLRPDSGAVRHGYVSGHRTEKPDCRVGSASCSRRNRQGSAKTSDRCHSPQRSIAAAAPTDVPPGCPGSRPAASHRPASRAASRRRGA